jgi:chitin synthase
MVLGLTFLRQTCVRPLLCAPFLRPNGHADLAEDRILCFELVAKAKSSWSVCTFLLSRSSSDCSVGYRVLKYVRNAVGETDVPDSLDELILQRRRWLNGSFFAAVYALAHFRQVLNAGHSFSRKCVLTVEMVYNFINLVFAWFAIGNFFLFFVSVL